MYCFFLQKIQDYIGPLNPRDDVNPYLYIVWRQTNKNIVPPSKWAQNALVPGYVGTRISQFMFENGLEGKINIPTLSLVKFIW